MTTPHEPGTTHYPEPPDVMEAWLIEERGWNSSVPLPGFEVPSEVEHSGSRDRFCEAPRRGRQHHRHGRERGEDPQFAHQSPPPFRPRPAAITRGDCGDARPRTLAGRS